MRRSGGSSSSSDEQTGTPKRKTLQRLFSSVLSGAASDGNASGSSSNEHVFPWQRPRTRPPSPAMSDNYSFLEPPHGEDVELMLTHNQLLEQYRNHTSQQAQRGPNRSPKHIFPRLLDSFGSMRSRSRRRSKRKPMLDEFGNLLPLDGEEGELVDDEACFVEEVQPVLGIGSLLPASWCRCTLTCACRHHRATAHRNRALHAPIS